MLSLSNPAPKLTCYGSEARGLVPIARHLAMEYLSDDDVLEHTVKQTTLELCACYDCLSFSQPVESLALHSQRFCTLFAALETQHPDRFRTKPKLHQFQELCEMDLPTRPAAHWTYREEEFGGSIAEMGNRRGGA